MVFVPVVFLAGSTYRVTYRDAGSSNVDKTNYNFGSLAIGPAPTASQKRYIFVAASAVGTVNPGHSVSAISSVSIGGSSATFVRAANNISLPLRLALSWWYKEVTSGTTADVDVVTDADADSAGCLVYSVLAPSVKTLSIPQDSIDVTPTSGVLSFGGLSVVPTDIVLAAAQGCNALGTTWGGDIASVAPGGTAGDVSEDLQTASTRSAISAAITATDTSLTINATNADTTPGLYTGVSIKLRFT